MNQEKLKLLRKHKGLTQQQLARFLGLSTSTVSMYEQGRREPDNKTLLKMSQVLGVSTDSLLSDSPEITETFDLQTVFNQARELALHQPEMTFCGYPINYTEVDAILNTVSITYSQLQQAPSVPTTKQKNIGTEDDKQN